MPDDERVAVSVLNNRTTQGRAEQNSAPFLESGQHAQARDSGKRFLGFRSRSSGQCCRTRTRTVCHVLDGAAATVLDGMLPGRTCHSGTAGAVFWRARGAAAPLLEVLGQPKHGEVWVVNAWGVAMGFFHSVLLHLSVSQTRRCTTSPPIVLVPIGEASHKYAERWAFGAEGDTIREPPMQDGKQSRQCRMTVTVGEKGWWTRRRGGGVVSCLRLEVSPQQIVVQLRCRCPPRRLSGSRRARAHGPRLRDCPVGPNVAIGRGESKAGGRHTVHRTLGGFVDRLDGRLGTHRDPRFAARVVARKQGTGLWQAGLLP